MIRNKFGFIPGMDVEIIIEGNKALIVKSRDENKFMRWLGRGEKRSRRGIDHKSEGSLCCQFSYYAEYIVMRSPLFVSPATYHIDIFLLRIREPACSEAISLSVALKRPVQNGS